MHTIYGEKVFAKLQDFSNEVQQCEHCQHNNQECLQQNWKLREKKKVMEMLANEIVWNII